MKVRCAACLIAWASQLWLALPAHAQSIWIPRDHDCSVTLSVAKPSLEFVDETTFSPAALLTTRLPVAEGAWLVAELPAAHLGSRDLFTLPSLPEGSVYGNPYLGLEFHGASGPIFGEVGIRPPLLDDKQRGAIYVGLGSDIQFEEAFLPRVLTIAPAINFRERTASGMVYRLRLSPTIDIPTQVVFFRKTEWFAIYSWQIGYEGRVIRLGSAFSGRLLVSEDYGNLGQRTANQFELHADVGTGTIRPGLDFRMPLGDDVASIVPYVLGVNVSWVR